MLTDDETAEQDELEEQLWTATEELQKAVMRLFQDGDIHPHLVVLALARVTGEVGAGAALAGGEEPAEALRAVAGGGGGGGPGRSCSASWPGSCGGPAGSSRRWCGSRRRRSATGRCTSPPCPAGAAG